MSQFEQMENAVMKAVQEPELAGRISQENKSAETLRDFGVAVLPVIERVIKTYQPKTEFERRIFIGDVLHAYFLMADEFGYDKAGDFLASLRGEYLQDALQGIYVQWTDRRVDRQETSFVWLKRGLLAVAPHTDDFRVRELLKSL
jgi:hypothetical protein